MSEPLTRKERDHFLRDDSYARLHPLRMEEWRRWEATVRVTEERAHHLLSALASARRLIEQDVPKEIVLENIERNLSARTTA